MGRTLHLDSLFNLTNENGIDGNNSNIILDNMIFNSLRETIKELKNKEASDIDNLPAALF